MEKEIDRLRSTVKRARAQGFLLEDDDDVTSQLQSPVINSTYTHTRNPSLMGSDEAVSSLLHLKRGGSYTVPRVVHELEEVRLTEETEAQLFHEFWVFYHPFLPFLNRDAPPELFYSHHPLLYWTIISVAARRYSPDSTLLNSLSGPLSRLLWTTIGDVPSSHYVVQALCLLCTWPLPTSTTSSDPTHILCGVMMKTATGIGLHRPNHSSDFSRVPVELDNEQLHDRVVTWAVCNIVAQNIGTGYGQPASTLYDWDARGAAGRVRAVPAVGGAAGPAGDREVLRQGVQGDVQQRERLARRRRRRPPLHAHARLPPRLRRAPGRHQVADRPIAHRRLPPARGRPPPPAGRLLRLEHDAGIPGRPDGACGVRR